MTGQRGRGDGRAPQRRRACRARARARSGSRRWRDRRPCVPPRPDRAARAADRWRQGSAIASTRTRGVRRRRRRSGASRASGSAIRCGRSYRPARPPPSTGARTPSPWWWAGGTPHRCARGARGPPVRRRRWPSWRSGRAPIGPLDAEQGARVRHRAARSVRRRPVAARRIERVEPGLTDFSRPSAPAEIAAPQGRGPGRARRGRAPGVGHRARGVRRPRSAAVGPGPERADAGPALRSLQEGDRAASESRARISESAGAATRTGRDHHKVRGGNRRSVGEGPHIVKSSGFEEFDSAAVRAVQRAAPFPPMPNRSGTPLARFATRNLRQSGGPVTRFYRVFELRRSYICCCWGEPRNA